MTQSSSITVLTLIGFVNAGMMTFRQSVNVMLGSEIGTTITAQLVSFDIGNFFWPLVAIGFFMKMFSKRESIQLIGTVIFSLGLLFLAMEFMKDRLLATKTNKKLLTLTGHEYGVRDITFSPEGNLIATGGFDGTAKVWDMETGNLIREISSHKGIVLGVAFSPNGAHLATASTDATVKIWNARTWELLFTLAGHDGGIRDIAYSPDGSFIATASGDGTVILWETATGSKTQTLIGHSSGVFSVTFSPDGILLATGSEDNTAKIWDVQTGKELLTLPGNLGAVTGVAFSSSNDEAHLVVSSVDGVARVFLLDIEELLALAHSRITRVLTTEECRKYLHVEQCPVIEP